MKNQVHFANRSRLVLNLAGLGFWVFLQFEPNLGVISKGVY